MSDPIKSDPSIPDSEATPQTPAEAGESFKDILSQYEKSHVRKPSQDGGKQIEATVITVSADSVILDIGFKTEGILPLAAVPAGETVKPGDKLLVSVKGRGPEGYYELSRTKVARPTDWPALEQAFADKSTILGTVTGVIKGGLSVDVGVRAFMPASRSGVRDAAEMEKLVGEEIRCRIIKVDVQDEDVVVDRRVVAEEEERGVKARRYSEIKEGETVSGTVRSFMQYGAFVDIGGIDALLHIGDIAWGRLNKPDDVLTLGEQIEVKVLKIDGEKHRISIGMKQLQPHPWDAAAEKYKTGERTRGVVTRVADFGAFVELEPGVEGLIHISEMSWGKKVRRPSDIVKPGDTVEAVVLGVNMADRRMSLGLKQALGDPWAEVAQRFPAGTAIEGPVTSLTKFGAFVQLAEGVEGMIHVSEITMEKRGAASQTHALAEQPRISHPQDVLKIGQTVKAQVIELDKAKRQVKLSMKQLVANGLDEFLAGHKEGDVVTGRMMDGSTEARVELGEGVFGICRIAAQQPAKEAAPAAAKADLSSLSAMLNARWKGGDSSAGAKPQHASAGEVRSFRITKLDPAAKKIELRLA
ncbi:MAG TPA: S1 RNA-binding domain-containing protein [Verrucomicrobiae bacterium]|jgi:small subunit ribosomal protein S1|nr:S1 RNA-binding domain-containing protein [Verrucomicrobiae bacterium]